MSSFTELEYTRDRLLDDLGNVYAEAQYIPERLKEDKDNRQAALYQWEQSFLTSVRSNGLSYRVYKISSCMNMITFRMS